MNSSIALLEPNQEITVRHFLRDDDLVTDERRAVLDLAVQIREEPLSFCPLEGPKSVAIVFDKPSTRTRVSFSVGVAEMGGMPIVMDSSSMQLGRGEPISDTARVLSAQVAAIVWRAYDQHDVEEMATFSAVPVINALTDSFHPCQLLADLLTIRDEFGSLEGVEIAYLGDISNNVANSLVLACVSEGMKVRLAGPNWLTLDADVLATAHALADVSGGSVDAMDDPKAAADDAHVLVTDTWVSMGDKPLDAEQYDALTAFQVDDRLVELASDDAIVLHCLPAHRGDEIADSVIDGPRSRVWHEAANRLHVQKALLSHLL